MNTIEVKYTPNETFKKFHASDCDVRCVQGKDESGIKMGLCADAFGQMIRIAPCKDNVRRSRWLFLSHSHEFIREGLVKTWLKWFPEDVQKNGSGMAEVNWSDPMIFSINLSLADGTTVDAKVFCLSPTSGNLIDRMRSMELTGAVVYDASLIPYENIRYLQNRLGRFPCRFDMSDGPDGKPVAVKGSLIMGAVNPEEGGWWNTLEKSTNGWAFFKQETATCNT